MRFRIFYGKVKKIMRLSLGMQKANAMREFPNL
jgi:hypothetical protein